MTIGMQLRANFAWDNFEVYNIVPYIKIENGSPVVFNSGRRHMVRVVATGTASGNLGSDIPINTLPYHPLETLLLFKKAATATLTIKAFEENYPNVPTMEFEASPSMHLALFNALYSSSTSIGNIYAFSNVAYSA